MARLIPRKQIEEQQNITGSLTINENLFLGNDAIVSGSIFVSQSFFLGNDTGSRNEITGSVFVTGSFTVDGLFFAEQVRVGDSLIAKIDSPQTLNDWTTVQDNTDLATLTTVGLGNVNAGAGISVSYSNGTATVSAISTSATGQITAGSLSGTVTHSFGINTMVQTFDSSTGDTIFCDVTRTSTTVTATIAAANASNIIILVQKIG
jgi:hypothetical protein